MIDATSSRHCHVGLLLLATLGASGCAWTRQAASVPVLTVPAAPPRTVAIYPPEPEPPPEEEVTVEDATEEAEDPEALAQRLRDALEPEAPPETAPPPPPAEERPEEASDRDVQVRRQLISADQEITRETVDQTLAETERLLGQLERNSFDSAGRAQYDTAQRFLLQARAAFAAENFVFAHYLGQKAEALASALL